MVLGVPGRLRPQIFWTFGTTREVGRQPNAPTAFSPGKIPGTHFQRLTRPQGKWFCRKELRKKSQMTPPGIDPRTVRLVAQRLNHYATPGPMGDILTHLIFVLLAFRYLGSVSHTVTFRKIFQSVSHIYRIILLSDGSSPNPFHPKVLYLIGLTEKKRLEQILIQLIMLFSPSPFGSSSLDLII